MKQILLIALCLMIGQFAMAQKISKADVPAGVLKTFESKMPDTIPVQWERSGTDYIGKFVKNDLHAAIYISGKEEWVMTVWGIPVTYLPGKLKKYIIEKYPGYKATQASIEYKPGSENYLVSIKKKKAFSVLRFSIKSDFVGVEPVPDAANSKDKRKKNKKEAGN
jgi:hypothetical protein